MELQLNVISQQYSNFDVNMAWDIKIIDGYTVVDGQFTNVRYATMEEIEIWVVLLDARGKAAHRAVCQVRPSRLDRDVAATFNVKLPTIASPGSKLVFTYKYSGCDGGDGTKWMQSFESSTP